MKMKKLVTLTIGLILLSVLVGCIQAAASEAPSTDTEAPETAIEAAYSVDIDPADFVMVIDNPYLPRLPGAKYVYEGQTEEGLERIELEVLADTKEVMGVTTTIVRDTVYVDGELVEDTLDWFAQDKDGNVWYFGEDVSDYEDGELVSKAGSWEAGVDGALPGILMYGDPAAHLGETYHQEYYEGEAEDMGRLLSVAETVTIPLGTFENVVQTEDFTPLEPGVIEHKFYAEDIGVIQEINLENDETVTLIEFTPAGAAEQMSEEEITETAPVNDSEGEADDDDDGDEQEDDEAEDRDEAAVAPDQTGITADEARAAVEAAYPDSTIVEIELEQENGQVIYEVELDNGLEVIVDAGNGDILGEEQEGQ